MGEVFHDERANYEQRKNETRSPLTQHDEGQNPGGDASISGGIQSEVQDFLSRVRVDTQH
jgi:hypothetical protein